MGDNNEQEAADLDAMNNDGDNLFEVIYRGGRLDNDYDGYDDEDFQHNPNPPHYTVPDGPFRLVMLYMHPSQWLIRLYVMVVLHWLK